MTLDNEEEECSASRRYFIESTGVDILAHAKYSNGRYHIKPEDLEHLANDIETERFLAK